MINPTALGKRFTTCAAFFLLIWPAQATALDQANVNSDTAATAQAFDARWKARLDYMIVTLPTRDVARKIAQDVGLKLVISDLVRGSLKRLRLSGSMQDVLDQFAANADLDWYTFAGTLYISSRSEVSSRFMPMRNLTAAQAIETLEQAGLLLPRFEVRATPGDGALLLSGPASWIAICDAVLETAVTAPPPRAGVLVRRGTEESVERPRN